MDVIEGGGRNRASRPKDRPSIHMATYFIGVFVLPWRDVELLSVIVLVWGGEKLISVIMLALHGEEVISLMVVTT